MEVAVRTDEMKRMNNAYFYVVLCYYYYVMLLLIKRLEYMIKFSLFHFISSINVY